MPDFSKCDFSNVKRMNFMFSGCIQLKKNNNIIKILDWKINENTERIGLFERCDLSFGDIGINCFLNKKK
jgi:hypothetical protein